MHYAAPPEAWTEWGGNGSAVVFGHANGFPPETYRVLLEELSRRFSVASFAARPLWPGSDPRSVSSWRDRGSLPGHSGRAAKLATEKRRLSSSDRTR